MQVRSPLTRKFAADYARTNRGVLCSRRFRDVLEETDSGILFYETKIIEFDGKKNETEYFLMHICARYKCLDYDASIFENRVEFSASENEDFDVLTHFDFIALNDALIGKEPCFYISNSPFPYMPTISEDIAKKLFKHSFSGVSVIPVSDFKWDEMNG